MGWVDLARQEEIAEGDHALFLVEGNAVKIRDREKGETINILGQVFGHLGGGSWLRAMCMSIWTAWTAERKSFPIIRNII